jgi:hypothetical protein
VKYLPLLLTALMRSPMKLDFFRLPARRTDATIPRAPATHATSRASLLRKSLFALCLSASALGIGCSELQSSVESLITGEAPADETYAGRQHFPVTPEEALACLITVAPQHGWEVVGSGHEYGMRGVPGTFFRLTPSTPSGEQPPTVSGVFYAEPSGSYVRVSLNNGLPEPLVEPLIAEMKRKVAER